MFRRDPTADARAAEAHALRSTTDAAWLVAGDAWEEAGDVHRAALLRSLRPSALRIYGARPKLIRGIEDGFWLNAWADAMERLRAPTPQHITRETADPMPPAVTTHALKYLRLLERMNKTTPLRIVAAASLADGQVIDPEALGYYLAMQSQGHGVSWTDDHACFAITLPSSSGYVDGYAARRPRGSRAPRLPVWTFYGELDTRFARELCE